MFVSVCADLAVSVGQITKFIPGYDLSVLLSDAGEQDDRNEVEERQQDRCHIWPVDGRSARPVPDLGNGGRTRRLEWVVSGLPRRPAGVLENGRLVPTPEELAEIQMQRAETEKQRAETEKQRAETEKQRAETKATCGSPRRPTPRTRRRSRCSLNCRPTRT